MALFRCTKDNQYDGITGYRKGQVYTFGANPDITLFDDISSAEANTIVIDTTPLPAWEDLERDWHVDVDLYLSGSATRTQPDGTNDADIATTKYVDDRLFSAIFIIQELADFPTPVAGVITLATGTYHMDGSINIGANTFLIEDGAAVFFHGFNVFGSQIIYTGTGTLFSDNSTSPGCAGNLLQIEKVGVILANGGTAFGFPDGGYRRSTFWLKSTYLVGSGSASSTIGTIHNFDFFSLTEIPIFILWDEGFDIADCGQVILNSQFTTWKDTGGTFISFTSGTFDRINFSGGGSIVTPGTTESVIYLEPTATYNSSVTINGVTNTPTGDGAFFAPGSLDETSVYVRLVNVGGVPDSVILGSFFYEDGDELTIINAQGTDGAITAFADAGGGQVTVTSVGHGLSDADLVVILYNDSYRGSYTITNALTDTYEITATFVATGTGTWEYGWEKINATTVEDIIERAEMSGDAEITYLMLETGVKQAVELEYSVRQLLGGTKTVQIGIFKNETRVEGYLSVRGASSSLGEGTLAPNMLASTNDIIDVRVRNMTDATNIQTTKLNMRTREA